MAGPVLVRLHEIREPAPQGPLIAPPGPWRRPTLCACRGASSAIPRNSSRAPAASSSGSIPSPTQKCPVCRNGCQGLVRGGTQAGIPSRSTTTRHSRHGISTETHREVPGLRRFRRVLHRHQHPLRNFLLVRIRYERGRPACSRLRVDRRLRHGAFHRCRNGGKWHPPIRRAGRCISRPGNLRNGIGAPGPGSRCWLNFVGQVGGAAATGYAATFVQAVLDLQWSSYEPTAHRTVLIMALIIVSRGWPWTSSECAVNPAHRTRSPVRPFAARHVTRSGAVRSRGDHAGRSQGIPGHASGPCQYWWARPSPKCWQKSPDGGHSWPTSCV